MASLPSHQSPFNGHGLLGVVEMCVAIYVCKVIMYLCTWGNFLQLVPLYFKLQQSRSYLNFQLLKMEYFSVGKTLSSAPHQIQTHVIFNA